MALVVIYYALKARSRQKYAERTAEPARTALHAMHWPVVPPSADVRWQAARDELGLPPSLDGLIVRNPALPENYRPEGD